MEQWRGRRVLVTGHSGFKGAWLSAWLTARGAKVCGFSLGPPVETEAVSRACGLEERLAASEWGDVTDGDEIGEAVARWKPEVVFHLAAQAFVAASYDDPAGTFQANVMGTVRVLEAVRATPSVRAVVVVTSDKCYENREWVWGYREADPLGGKDPYSASKGAAELVTSAYARSFFERAKPAVGCATVRAGNVFGGGDWGEHRLAPDAVRALAAGRPLRVRNPASVRPWQHVLEPLSGYLEVARRLCAEPAAYGGAWNFGPAENDTTTVGELADTFIAAWGEGRWETGQDAEVGPEAGVLRLDASKARQRLGWRPRLALGEAVAWTVEWYRAVLKEKGPEAMWNLTLDQIARYEALGGGQP